MGLIKVTAAFACDECGENMVAEMEAAYVPPPGWAIFDIAEDALRGGMTSVQDGKHLCAACTRAAGRTCTPAAGVARSTPEPISAPSLSSSPTTEPIVKRAEP